MEFNRIPCRSHFFPTLIFPFAMLITQHIQSSGNCFHLVLLKMCKVRESNRELLTFTEFYPQNAMNIDWVGERRTECCAVMETDVFFHSWSKQSPILDHTFYAIKKHSVSGNEFMAFNWNIHYILCAKL